jgi:CRISPR system Cascade subunit CasA
MDLLTESVIRTEPTGSVSLPCLLTALVRGKVASYPGIRVHQEDPWHATICQLAAYVLHRARRTDVPDDEADWRGLLKAATVGQSSAWCLVGPHDQPAFMQPATDTVVGWSYTNNPAALDAILPVKEHDTKLGPASGHAPADQWLFALVALQTCCGSLSAKYAQTSRMNGGLSSRLFVGVTGTPGARFVRDVRMLLAERERIIAASPGYADEGGIALTWMVPWNTSFIPKAKLDPFYVDTPRRVRLVKGGSLTVAASGLRTIGKEALGKGLTGDPWAPVDGKRHCTLSLPDLSYRRVAPILTGADDALPSCAQIVRETDPDPVELRLSLLTGGQPGRTRGHHVRTVAIPAAIRGLLAVGDRRLGTASRERIETLGAVEKAVREAIAYGWKANRNVAVHTNVITRVTDAWQADEDARFFPDLWAEMDADEPLAARREWLQRLVNLTGPEIVRRGVRFVLGHSDLLWRARVMADRSYDQSRHLRTVRKTLASDAGPKQENP